MNMKKEYRRELRQLALMEWKMNNDCKRALMLNWAQVRRLERERERIVKRVNREGDRLARRRGILEGRLA